MLQIQTGFTTKNHLKGLWSLHLVVINKKKTDKTFVCCFFFGLKNSKQTKTMKK